MQVKIRLVDMNSEKILRIRGLGPNREAQKFIDSEVLRLCENKVPRDNGELIRSGIRNTVVGSGQVIWWTPYARRWYYEPANFQGAPTRGNYWFERMKNEGGAQQILQGVAKITGGRIG